MCSASSSRFHNGGRTIKCVLVVMDFRYTVLTRNTAVNQFLVTSE